MTTENISSASSSQSTFSIGFTVPTDTSEIQVYVEDATTGAMTLQTAGTHYNIVGTDVVFTSGNEPPAGTENVQILRNTDVASTNKHRTFVAGSSIRAADLNANFTRLFDHAEDKIQTDDIANKAVTTAKIAKFAVTTNRIASSAVTSNKIASDAVVTGKIVDGAITSEKINNSAVITNKINPLAVTTGKINDQAVTTAKIADNAVTPAKLSETYLTQSEIINLVDDVGGFVPIANETSFPATNPDLNNSFGTLISIQEIVGTYNAVTNNSMSAIDIPNGAGTGNTVTISGPASSFSFPQGYGAIVETTNTLHLYNLHRIVPKSSDVTTVAGSVSNINTVAGSISNVNSVASNVTNVNTVAGDISNVNTAATNIANINTAASNISNVNNFTEKYQIASSDPTTDGGGNALAEGDLYFNSSANQLKIYNGSTWQNGITAPSDNATTTGNTFTGDNQYNDNVNAKFGSDGDLKIHHNGTDSFIENSTGVLHIRSKAGEEAIKLLPDSAVQIYHDNAIAIHTQTWGNQLYGTLQALGDVEPFLDSSDTTKAIRFKNNTGEALRILHQSSNSYITNNVGSLFIEAKNGETGISVIPDDAVELYYDNAKKFETASWGSEVFGSFVANGDLKVNKSSSAGKLKIGVSSEFTIHHDGTDTFIENTVGNLHIRPKSSEEGIKLIPDGAAELYYDGTKKFETTSNGWKSTDNNQGVFGTGDDLSIYHDGSNSYIKNITGTLFIKASSGRDGIEIRNNGKVSLFYQGVEKFRTTSTGTETIGQSTASGAGIVGFKVPDNPTISNETTTHGLFMAGNGNDLMIGHNGTDSFITNDTGNLTIDARSGETGIKVVRDGAVELYYDGGKKFETTSNGAKIEKAGTAQFHLVNTNTSGANHVILGVRSYSDDGDTMIRFGTSADDNPGEIKYFSDLNRFQLRVNGTNLLTCTNTALSPNSDNAVALGTSAKRFTTLYSAALNTGDIHMNNLNSSSGNEVDGTKGSWSLQEGADDLFLINRVSGKKYKFNLTEIS